MIESAQRDSRTRIPASFRELAWGARRIRSAGTPMEMAAAVADVAGRFAARAAVFLINTRTLRLASAVGAYRNGPPAPGMEVPLAGAPAFESAVDTLDCVCAIHSPSELSAALSRALPAPAASRVALVPVVSQGRAAAVIYVENGPEPIDLAPVEILAELAGCALDARAPAAAPAPAAGLVTLGSSGSSAPENEAGAAFSGAQRELHLRAQRLSRVRVAEIRQRRSHSIKEGRAASDLYMRLQEEIDAARDAYRREFIDTEYVDIDYLHQELVHAIANDDESLLGPRYPGPLV